MHSNNKKKSEQLGMNAGTASNRLKKKILFKLVEKCGENVCYQCGKLIEHEKDLSIEHKTPWLDSEDPVSLFFDEDNITFSHLKCNIKAHRHTGKVQHGTPKRYQKGCRCDKCQEAGTRQMRHYSAIRTSKRLAKKVKQ